MNKQGTIVRWDADRGFGFVRSPSTDADVFFHVRDFRGGSTSPAEGLQVRYEEIHVGGKGPRAMSVMPVDYVDPRRPAPPVVASEGSGGRRRGPAPAYVAAEIRTMLLLVPAYAALLVWAAWSLRLPVPVVLAAPLCSVVTFYLYWRDKFAAQRGAWRTPENVLHAASLAGGWPGAWFAQRLLRHKSAKHSFRQVYWGTVVVHWTALLLWLYTAPAR